LHHIGQIVKCKAREDEWPRYTLNRLTVEGGLLKWKDHDLVDHRLLEECDLLKKDSKVWLLEEKKIPLTVKAFRPSKTLTPREVEYQLEYQGSQWKEGEWVPRSQLGRR
jgi:hypothetical protein